MHEMQAGVGNGTRRLVAWVIHVIKKRAGMGWVGGGLGSGRGGRERRDGRGGRGGGGEERKRTIGCNDRANAGNSGR
jgi:hypothetical protein